MRILGLKKEQPDPRISRRPLPGDQDSHSNCRRLIACDVGAQLRCTELQKYGAKTLQRRYDKEC